MTLIEYILLFATQVANAVCRAWNIRCLASDSKLLAHLSWQLYGIAWLSSVWLGIKSLSAGDLIGVVIWFTASGIGLELGQRMKK